MCGATCYEAPELLGILPSNLQKRNRYTTAVDLWALGTVIHKVLTTHGPFQESWSAMNIDKALRSSLEDQEPQLAVNMIYRYCHGLEPFPVQPLKMNGVEEAGIDFLKSLMAADPGDRASAKDALKCLPGIRDLCPGQELDPGKPLSPVAIVPSSPYAATLHILDNQRDGELQSGSGTSSILFEHGQDTDKDNCETVSRSRTMAEEF